MKLRTFNLLAGTSLLALASAASAQTAPTGSGAAPKDELEEILSLEEIVVTARRKDESLQDVPTTINAVTGEDIQKLNIKTFADIATVVPGLTMGSNANGIGASASVRGVNYDVNASGNNGTVEFYLNDAPISAGNLFQTVYDIQQVELLRGPQGTLRGRASPSGSMTVTTRRPDLQDVGGYVSASGNNIGGYNAQGGVNFPIISNMLAIRVAGAYDKNEGNRVVSLNNSVDPSVKSKSGRATVRFEPTDSLSFVLTAQKTKVDSITFEQVESQQEVRPDAPVRNSAVIPLFAVTYVPPYITAGQRLAVVDTPTLINQDFNNYNLQVQWAFLGQKLNYVGARNEQKLLSFAPQDVGDYFSPLSNAVYQGFGQQTDSRAYATAHELRLSNEERVMDMFDYIVGAFAQKGNFPTSLDRNTATFNPNQGPPFSDPTLYLYGLSKTHIIRGGGSDEKSVFINLTAHLLGDAMEVSAGTRYIDYESHGTLNVAGNALPTAEDNGLRNHTMIYTGSIKYNFTEDFMAYASFGTSWRPRITSVGDFSLAQSALERSFQAVEPEKSKSYEGGFKSTMLDKRLRTNVSLYYQKFDNYPYRSASGVWFIDTLPPAQGGARANVFNFVAGVPVDVKGAELQVDFSATKNWDAGLSAAISKGQIKNGVIPCNDVNGDGVPDSDGVVPTLTTLQTAYGANNLASCTVTQNASTSPQWSGSVQSEYRMPITAAINSFVRGQLSVYGNSGADPIYTHDNVKGYELLNLYLGVRDPSGAWEVSLYGKNVTNTERVLSTGGYTMTTPLNLGVGQSNYYGGDSVSGLKMTAPREFGLNIRYAFGSR